MNNSQTNIKNQRLELIKEIDETPEESIPELLKMVRFFREISLVKQTSLTNWDLAIAQLNNSDTINQKEEKIKELCQSWGELNDENEQKETLKIIESLEDVSI